MQNYISKSDNSEFYEVSIDDTSTFDILIDKSTIKDIDSNLLKNTVDEYGSILIQIKEDIVDKNIPQNFIKSLRRYKKQGNKIGLAMLFGESVTQDSYDLINKLKDKITEENIILIEKHSTDADLKNLNNMVI
ncbi:MAG: hypothetical protein R3321_11400 [Nitrososphaeraceae archaeon]|nr:hypothetical protein [Nitrososphaeraceae archaeon]